jgi:amino acid transporter
MITGQTQYVAHPFAGAAMDANGWMVALFAGIYSYGGWDALNYGTEDVKDRRKAFPFAVLSGMAVVTALYLGMNFAYFVVLSPAEFEQSKAVAIVSGITAVLPSIPAQSFAHKTMGPLAFVMPLLIMLVLVGSINASYFGASRFLWAAARERHVPAFINCLNLRHDSPRAALYIQAFL